MNRYTVAGVLALILLFAVFNRTVSLNAIAGERSQRIAIIYTPGDGPNARAVRAAYAQTMLESGIPFDWLASTDIGLFDAEQLATSYAAVVFADGINEHISEDAVAEMQAYAAIGGTVAVIGDAGMRTLNGSFRPDSLFTEITGVNSVLYDSLKTAAFGHGAMHFSDPHAIANWRVPAGKIDDGDLSSYQYGPLTYPFSRAYAVDAVRTDAAHRSSPMLTVRDIGSGRVAYIGLPLGYLRLHSDGFPMQMLVTFLTRSAQIPHLVAAPDGIGRLVIDIHIDSGIEFSGIPNLERFGLLRRAVPMEFDVTAGPDLNRRGDRLGFDACGRGKPYLQTLMKYASRIGSHGGWAHNEFAADITAGRDTPEQVRALIDRNDRCLESVTHVPVRSFAAPVGVHPQPMMTQQLDALGIAGYYYTGDTGSPVERPFFNGALVSTKSWAFPILPEGKFASIAEMRRGNVPPASVERWMDGNADYADAERGIYLFYSHSYDLLHTPYARAMARFLDHVTALERAGRLRTTNMADMSDFMTRFVATGAAFTRDADGVHVRLTNVHGLRGIAFAVPTAWLRRGALPAGLIDRGTQGIDTVLSVDAAATSLDVTLPGAAA